MLDMFRFDVYVSIHFLLKIKNFFDINEIILYMKHENQHFSPTIFLDVVVEASPDIQT